MPMDLTLSLYITVFVSLISHANAGCWVEGFDEDCNYTIVCESRAEYVELPVCSAHNPTLLIRNSTLEIFTMKFYQPTDFAELITNIKAINNNWTTLAPFAFNFFHCTHIDLSNNGIKIISDNSFRTSYSLRELNLSRNAIDKLYPSSFKVSDYSWSNHITVLDLSFNMLTEISNGTLHSLPELKVLYLHANKIFHLTDDSFTNLNNLNVLYLNHNQLTMLNVSLVGLRKLKELDVSFNRLKHLHQNELIHAKSLENVIMSHNSINTLDLKAFRYAKNLQSIDLSNNKLKSLLLAFYKNAKLKSLNFSNNSISAIDYAASYHLDTVESVDFSMNNLSVLAPRMIKSAKNLKTLNLSSNCLTNLDEGSLKSLKNITVIDLSHNKLMNLDVNEFKQSVNLNRLVLDYNLLQDIDFTNLVKTVTKLEAISVGGNPIPCHSILDYYKKGLEVNVTVTSIDKIYDRTNIFGITCNLGSVIPVGKPNFRNEVLIWTLLMSSLIFILLTAGIRTCIDNCYESKRREVIELGIIEEQQTSLM